MPSTDGYSEYSWRHPISSVIFEGGSSRQSRASDKDQWEDDPPQRAGNDYKPPRDRIYYADWTRALAI